MGMSDKIEKIWMQGKAAVLKATEEGLVVVEKEKAMPLFAFKGRKDFRKFLLVVALPPPQRFIPFVKDEIIKVLSIREFKPAEWARVVEVFSKLYGSGGYNVTIRLRGDTIYIIITHRPA